MLFFHQQIQTYHHHNSINTNIMPTIALLNKKKYSLVASCIWMKTSILI